MRCPSNPTASRRCSWRRSSPHLRGDAAASKAGPFGAASPRCGRRVPRAAAWRKQPSPGSRGCSRMISRTESSGRPRPAPHWPSFGRSARPPHASAGAPPAAPVRARAGHARTPRRHRPVGTSLPRGVYAARHGKPAGRRGTTATNHHAPCRDGPVHRGQLQGRRHPPGPGERVATGAIALLKAFPAESLEFTANPAKFLSATWSIATAAPQPGDPWICTLELKNISKLTLTAGRGAMLAIRN